MRTTYLDVLPVLLEQRRQEVGRKLHVELDLILGLLHVGHGHGQAHNLTQQHTVTTTKGTDNNFSIKKQKTQLKTTDASLDKPARMTLHSLNKSTGQEIHSKADTPTDGSHGLPTTKPRLSAFCGPDDSTQIAKHT